MTHRRISATQRAVLGYLFELARNDEQTSPEIAVGCGKPRSSVHDNLVSMYRGGLVTRRWIEHPETLVETRVYQLTNEGEKLAVALAEGTVASATDAINLGLLQ